MGASPIFSYDDIQMWPAETHRYFVNAGLIREIAPAESIILPECSSDEPVTPLWSSTQTGQRIGLVSCGDDQCAGLHCVKPERMKRWEINFAGLTAILAAAMQFTQTEDIVPGRISLIGSCTQNDTYREIFLARGLHWPDAPQVLGKADRLRASPAPAILVVDQHPTADLWREFHPAIISLPAVVLVEHNIIKLNLAGIFRQGSTPHAEAKTSEWLTVSEAAALLMHDFPGLSLEKAKARVSANASRKQFKTNGKKHHDRRIDSDSFAAWRLRQRDKDLDSEEWDG